MSALRVRSADAVARDEARILFPRSTGVAGSGEGRAWADDTAVASKDHNFADDMRAERMRRVLSK